MEECRFLHTKAVISLKRGMVGGRTKVTFITIEDQYEILYKLSIVPSSTTLDDFEGLLCTSFT